MTDFSPKAPARGVTWRAIILGLVLIWPNAWWIYMMEIVRYAGHPTTISLFFNSILVLLALVLFNGLLKRVRPAWVFSQIELLTIYIMLNIGSALAGHDFIQVLVPVMTHVFWFSNATNRWEELVWKNVPEWLSVRNRETLESFYSGNDKFLAWDNLQHWIAPLAWWGSFIVVMVLSMLCLVLLLRKQWTERERLAYPLVQLPLDMTAEGAPLFRNRLMWAGLAFAALIDVWNGFAFLYPQMPGIPIKTVDITSSFAVRPWNAIGWMPLCFYPFAVGLGILLPLDLSFSCWFFFMVWKAQRVLSAVWGWDSVPGFPYVNEQSFGAYLGIAVFAFWASRKHLALLARGAFDWKKDLGDQDEPVSYRLAGLGFVAGALYMVFFAHRAGMSWAVVVPFFIIYWLLALAITRMRAELGPPAHDLHDAGPDRIIATIANPHNLSDRDLTALSQFFWFNRAYRSHPMPFQLEGFKMAERTKMNYRRLGLAMVLATVFGTAAAFYAVLTLTYKVGAATNMAWPDVPLIFGGEPYNRLDSWLKTPQAVNVSVNTGLAAAVGFSLTIALNSLRMAFPWFPFHPVGYAVSSSWSMHRLWLCLFLAWLIKAVVLRYGGLQSYKKALPFFMGLILGECIIGGGWILVGLALNIPTYAFWP